MKIPILNIREFEKQELQDDFYSNRFSTHIAQNKNHINIPHSHDFYLCVLFTSGLGKHEIDFNTYSIRPGSVFFIKPGQSHFWEFDQTPEGYIFFHTQGFYDFYFLNHKLSGFPFWYSLSNPPVLNLEPEKLESVQALFEQINSENAQDKPYKSFKLINLLNLVYIALSREYSQTDLSLGSSSPTYIRILGDLEELIEEFFRQERSAHFYADKLSITAHHLNRITKETLNKTTTDLISERVILEAKRLIVHSKSTFTGISEMLGYSDYAYFSRVFKTKTGVTPLDFKRAYQSI